MITVFQFRAARYGIGISLQNLSEMTGISYATLCKLEKGPIYAFPKLHKTTLNKLIAFYQTCGLVFQDYDTVKVNLPSS